MICNPLLAEKITDPALSDLWPNVSWLTASQAHWTQPATNQQHACDRPRIVPVQLSTYPLPLGGYYEDQGTSMSCPALVGTAALLLQARPGPAPRPA